MASVTIEGSVTPSVVLSRGRRMTVERTPYIDALIRGGFVVVIEDHGAVPEAVLTPEQTEAFTAALNLDTVEQKTSSGDVVAVDIIAPDTDTEDDTEDDTGGPEVVVIAPERDAADTPARNASRPVWSDFLRRQHVEHPKDAGRDALLAIWDEHNGG